MKAKQVSLILFVTMVVSLVMIDRAQAKELVKVTIMGPGLNSEIELTDLESLKVIRELGFADQTYQPTLVENEPYFEIRTAVGDGKEIVATSVYYYYPPSKEHPSYIYYAGAMNAWSSRDGQYFLLPEDTDQKLHDLLANLGASLPERTKSPTLAFRLPLSFLWLIVGGCLSIMIAIARKLKRSAATTRLPN